MSRVGANRRIQREDGAGGEADRKKTPWRAGQGSQALKSRSEGRSRAASPIGGSWGNCTNQKEQEAAKNK